MKIVTLFSVLMMILLIVILIGCSSGKRYRPLEEPMLPGYAYDYPQRPPTKHELRTLEIYKKRPHRMKWYLREIRKRGK